MSFYYPMLVTKPGMPRFTPLQSIRFNLDVAAGRSIRGITAVGCVAIYTTLVGVMSIRFMVVFAIETTRIITLAPFVVRL